MELAIKGHPTKGKEVIEVLEMLGGINKSDYNGQSNDLVYYVDRVSKIDASWTRGGYYCLTLEEFKELYPYKIGDEVLYFSGKKTWEQGCIGSVGWDTVNEQLYYYIKKGNTTVGKSTVDYLKPIMKQKELKDYLKPGYVVEYGDSTKFVITQDVHGNNFGLQLGTAIMWSSLDALDSIVKVYQIDRPGALHKTFDQDTRLTLVWEKPKEVELTMQEIADKFGISVDQLKIKK